MDEIGSLVFLGIGVALVIQSRLRAARVRGSESWLPTTGTVTRSEVVHESLGGSASTTRYYQPVIEYTYVVDGRDYQSNAICVGGTLYSTLRGRAAKRCARYPSGMTVQLFYDPMAPASACLERTAEGVGLFTAAGIGGILLGALSYFGIVRLPT